MLWVTVERCSPSLDVLGATGCSRFPEADLLERSADFGARCTRIGAKIEREAQVTLSQVFLTKLLSQPSLDAVLAAGKPPIDGDDDNRPQRLEEPVEDIRLNRCLSLIFEPRQYRPGHISPLA